MASLLYLGYVSFGHCCWEILKKKIKKMGTVQPKIPLYDQNKVSVVSDIITLHKQFWPISFQRVGKYKYFPIYYKKRIIWGCHINSSGLNEGGAEAPC